MKTLTIKEMRKAVADDLYDTLTNDSRYRSSIATEIVAQKSDLEVRQMYSEAGLGESIDE